MFFSYSVSDCENKFQWTERFISKTVEEKKEERRREDKAITHRTAKYHFSRLISFQIT